MPMLIAGIDEAGYGPLLGPLVVGCCAFEIDADPPADGELPCLWKRLGKLVSKTRSRSGRKLHVNDSKLVYAPADGLKELERSVLAMAAASGEWMASFDQFITRVAPNLTADIADSTWYQPRDGQTFPLMQEGVSIKLFANGLRAEMERTGTRCAHLAARVLLEKPLNRMLAQTRNKSNALFSIAAIHLDHLLQTYGERNLVIFCDRQGGRAHYGQLLRLMFEEWSLEILKESDGRSDYVLHRNGHRVRLTFCEKAETQCLPVALASMLSKYLREGLMHRFNTWWQVMLPDLTPTAGYHTDGLRFLADIDAKRKELGIGDGELIRLR